MKYLKIILCITIVQILSWILFFIADFIQEITNRNIFSVFCFCIVYIFLFVLSMLYSRFEKKINIPKLKLFMLSIFTWILESLTIGLNIWNLVNYNNWIIKQDRSGMLNLNGLEYFIFIWILTLLPIIVIIFIKIFEFICKKICNKKINKEML